MRGVENAFVMRRLQEFKQADAFDWRTASSEEKERRRERWAAERARLVGEFRAQIANEAEEFLRQEEEQ